MIPVLISFVDDIKWKDIINNKLEKKMSDEEGGAGQDEFDVEWPSDNEDREINEDEVEL
jgi:hypothetical protein